MDTRAVPAASGPAPERAALVLPASQLCESPCSCGFAPTTESWPTGLEICVPAGRRLAVDADGQDDRLYYVDDGQLRVVAGDRCLTAGPDDVVIVPAGCAHHLQTTGDEPARLILLLSARARRHFAGHPHHQ